MPTQQVICCKDRTVVVKVYVEKPRKKRAPANQHHHHYHIRHTFRREIVHRGYDRRVELLRYSQLLRDSARVAPSKPLLSNNVNPQPTTRIVPSQGKPKHAGKPACFGSWKLLIPSFLISWISTKPKEKKKKRQMQSGVSLNQITSMMDKFVVKRRKAFIP